MNFWKKNERENFEGTPNSENIEAYFQKYFDIMDNVSEAKKEAQKIQDKIKEYCNGSDAWKGNTSTFGVFKIRKVRARKFSYPKDIISKIGDKFKKTVLDEKKVLEAINDNSKELKGLDIKVNFNESIRIEKS